MQLYRSSGDHREAFSTLLVQKHPWDTEVTTPAGAVQPISAVIGKYLGNPASPVGAWVALGTDLPPNGTARAGTCSCTAWTRPIAKDSRAHAADPGDDARLGAQQRATHDRCRRGWTRA